MSGQFRTCPHCQRLTLNQRCDHPDCTGPGARVTMPGHVCCSCTAEGCGCCAPGHDEWFDDEDDQ